MKYYQISDRETDTLQFETWAQDAVDALKDFDEAVGIDPNDEGLDVVALRFHVREIDLATLELTDEQYSALFAEDFA